MTPRIGRPPKNGIVKNVHLQFRITEKTADELKKCAEILSISRTEVIEKGVEQIYKKAIKNNKKQ